MDMTDRELANFILRTGEKGYKDRDEGFKISHEITTLIKDHVKAAVHSKLNNELSQLWRWYSEAGMYSAANVVLGKIKKDLH